MKLRLFDFSISGDKQFNEDFTGSIINQDFALFVVADGLGGHQSGGKASRFFTESLIGEAGDFASKVNDNPVVVFKDWFNAAIEGMDQKFGSDETAGDAHTTCVILFISDALVMTVHCGDSRIYRLLPDKLLWRTKDHSKVQHLIDIGDIVDDDRHKRRVRNALTRTVSVNKKSKPEIKIYPPIRAGETFVLCSDGFWNQTQDSGILEMAQAVDSEDDLIEHIKAAHARAKGKSDNISVQLVKVENI